jgi:hypothetical protein
LIQIGLVISEEKITWTGSPFGNWILRDNANIIKQTKNCTDSLH